MWGTYNLKKLFGPAIRGKRLKNADRIPGSLP
ncbi:restriction endonuclease subunit S, partial [Escherichia coli]|nr:restriction endonuclease subunit S [Escherichia coli]